MSPRTRRILFYFGAAGLVTILAWGVLGLPAYGQYQGPYGDLVSYAAVQSRHATDVVSAVNFDIRAIDTLGEEFILFTSVMGVVLLLRKRVEPKDMDENATDVATGREKEPPSNAVRLLCLGLVGVSVLFGLYIVTHGQLTPGGGFQGGVVLATVPLLVYLAADVRVLHQIAPRKLVDAGEALAAGAFIGLGLVAVALQEPFLTNFLPLGTTGRIDSSGTIMAISIVTGIEVGGAFVVLLSSFLAETLERIPEEHRGEP